MRSVFSILFPGITVVFVALGSVSLPLSQTEDGIRKTASITHSPEELLTFTGASPTTTLEMAAPTLTSTLSTATTQPDDVLTATLAPAPSTTPAPTFTETPAPTPTSTPVLKSARGTARYQHSDTNQAGIEIMILDAERSLLDQAITNTKGAYTIRVPQKQPFWLLVDAPLYRRYEIAVQSGEPLPIVTLEGGDLDDDGCINTTDLAVLTANFDVPRTPASDITGDGITDVIDLAILAANFDQACVPLAATSTPTPTTSATPEPAETATLTPQPTLTPTIAEPSPMPTIPTSATPTEETLPASPTPAPLDG